MSDPKRFRHHIEIDAPLEPLWALTAAIETWPSFTPTMTHIERLDEGPLSVGSTARVKQPGQPHAVWTVTTLDPPTTFAWETSVLGMTIMAGHHLEATNRGCRHTLVIEVSGAGSGVFTRLAGGRIARSLLAENEAFKKRAEQTSRPS